MLPDNLDAFSPAAGRQADQQAHPSPNGAAGKARSTADQASARRDGGAVLPQNAAGSDREGPWLNVLAPEWRPSPAAPQPDANDGAHAAAAAAAR